MRTQKIKGGKTFWKHADRECNYLQHKSFGDCGPSSLSYLNIINKLQYNQLNHHYAIHKEGKGMSDHDIVNVMAHYGRTSSDYYVRRFKLRTVSLRAQTQLITLFEYFSENYLYEWQRHNPSELIGTIIMIRFRRIGDDATVDTNYAMSHFVTWSFDDTDNAWKITDNQLKLSFMNMKEYVVWYNENKEFYLTEITTYEDENDIEFRPSFPRDVYDYANKMNEKEDVVDLTIASITPSKIHFKRIKPLLLSHKVAKYNLYKKPTKKTQKK
jgi:hypothetical protein